MQIDTNVQHGIADLHYGCQEMKSKVVIFKFLKEIVKFFFLLLFVVVEELKAKALSSCRDVVNFELPLNMLMLVDRVWESSAQPEWPLIRVMLFKENFRLLQKN